MKIIIVDDHPLFREGLKAIINRSDQFEVVAEAGNGREGAELAKLHRPDIMLVDISMPEKNGIQLIRDLKAELPETQFLIISMHAEVDYIVESFRSGAAGYMIKESAASNLAQGLDAVARGEMFLDKSLSQEVVFKLMQTKPGMEKKEPEPYSTLTPREQEVLRMLAEGLSTKEVADALFISKKTVENHRTNLMKKLGLGSTVELIRYAARLGLIDLDSWAI